MFDRIRDQKIRESIKELKFEDQRAIEIFEKVMNNS